MRYIKTGLLLLLLLLSIGNAKASALSTGVEATQTLQEPITKIFFKDANGNTIDQPKLSFPIRTASFKCQTETTGGPHVLLGTDAQKLYVDVPDKVSNGWDISLAPTDGVEAGWSNPENQDALAINDPTSQGCEPSGNVAGSFGGLMSVNPTQLISSGQCSTDCGDPFTSPQAGSSTNFAQTSAASLYHSDIPHVGWIGTIKNIALSQTIPAGTPSGEYSLPMTLTLTEL